MIGGGIAPRSDQRRIVRAMAEAGWYDKNSERRTHQVGQKKPNSFGLSDMHGNVWEWYADWYDADYYEVSPASDPQGPSTGSRRVWRGGSWNLLAVLCRSVHRDGYVPSDPHYGMLGFRVALVPSGP